MQQFKKIVKFFVKYLIYIPFKPAYRVFFNIIPFQLLAFICGLKYGIDSKNIKHRLASIFVGNNLDIAGEIYNQRLLKLPVEKRRKYSQLAWQVETTTLWQKRAFDFTESRCNSYVYNAISAVYSDLKRPLSVLELGSMNGGGLLPVA